jgi:hypothetical protein
MRNSYSASNEMRVFLVFLGYQSSYPSQPGSSYEPIGTLFFFLGYQSSYPSQPGSSYEPIGTLFFFWDINPLILRSLVATTNRQVLYLHIGDCYLRRELSRSAATNRYSSHEPIQQPRTDSAHFQQEFSISYVNNKFLCK